tara:strand:- start:310 stop:447 length:138 start_codon:yes stop_codon:yes gene_type:complete
MVDALLVFSSNEQIRVIKSLSTKFKVKEKVSFESINIRMWVFFND